MKANVPKPQKNLHKSWFKLPQWERDAITEDLTDRYYKHLNHEEAELQKVWLKIMCIANHDVLGVGKVRAMSVLFRWKRLYRIVGKFETTAERDAWLDAELEKIFGKGGYPSEWVDSLEDGGN